MEQHGGREHFAVTAFAGMDAHGIAEDAQDMDEVVRAVRRVGSMRQQPGREGFKGRKGLRVDGHGDSDSGLERNLAGAVRVHNRHDSASPLGEKRARGWPYVSETAVSSGFCSFASPSSARW
jgi:hypothetical protein